MKNLLLCAAVMFAGLLAGCSSGSSGPAAPTLTSIAVGPSTASVAAGLTQQFTATGTYSNNSTQNLTTTATWASSIPTVTVAGGLATTSAQGTATITATSNGITSPGVTLTITPPVLESIAVTPSNDTVPVGTLTQLAATGTYSDKSTQNLTTSVTWASSNVAQVPITTGATGGLATALAPTSVPVTITATSSDGAVSGNTQLTVSAAVLTSIVIPNGTQNIVTLAEGTSYQFTALGYYDDGSKHNITSQVAWSSATQAVATIVSNTGHAQSVTQGSTTITAQLGSLSATATLDVTSATIQSIAVGPSSETIAPLTTQAFSAVGSFSDASTQNITHDVVWASSNPSAATVSNISGSVGIATGVNTGTSTASTDVQATFTAQGVTQSGFAPLSVTTAALQTITVTPTNPALTAGVPGSPSTLALHAVGTFSDGTTQNVDNVASWTSSEASVATVNANVVTGVGNGPATISCTLNGVTGGASVTVEMLASIAITAPDNSTVAEGTAIGLVATGTLTDGRTQNLTNSALWTSSNPSIATVSSASGSFGQLAGIAPGAVTVTAEFAGQIAAASLTVTNATLTSIAVNPTAPTIDLGQSQQFTATGTFSDQSTEDLTQQVIWISSNPAVAIINNDGAIAATGTGTATIEAAFGTINNTATLTVNP
ncbi:MAG: Ig-like domain-containing protein [Terriglobales bacterium]